MFRCECSKWTRKDVKYPTEKKIQKENSQDRENIGNIKEQKKQGE